ncbi:7330_t:CDS:1, partial [Acaulospora colombiana]
MVEEQRLSRDSIFDYEDDEQAFRSPMPLHISNSSRNSLFPPRKRIASTRSAFSLPDFGTSPSHVQHEMSNGIETIIGNHLLTRNPNLFDYESVPYITDINDAPCHPVLSPNRFPLAETPFPSPSRTAYRSMNTSQLGSAKTSGKFLGEGIAHRSSESCWYDTPGNRRFQFSHASPRPGPSFMTPSSHITSPELYRPTPKRSYMESTSAQFSPIESSQNAPHIFSNDKFASRSVNSINLLEAEGPMNR